MHTHMHRLQCNPLRQNNGHPGHCARSHGGPVLPLGGPAGFHFLFRESVGRRATIAGELECCGQGGQGSGEDGLRLQKGEEL